MEDNNLKAIAPSTHLVGDKNHPIFIAGYTAGLKDGKLECSARHGDGNGLATDRDSSEGRNENSGLVRELDGTADGSVLRAARLVPDLRSRSIPAPADPLDADTGAAKGGINSCQVGETSTRPLATEPSSGLPSCETEKSTGTATPAGDQSISQQFEPATSSQMPIPVRDGCIPTLTSEFQSRPTGCQSEIVPGEYELWDGEVREVVQPLKSGYWRFHAYHQEDASPPPPAPREA